MTEYMSKLQQRTQPAVDFMTRLPKDSLNAAAERISNTTAGVLENITSAMAQLLSKAIYMKNMAIQTVGTLRGTLHGACDGWLVGIALYG